MRKDIALPVLALAGGGACLALRRWQLAAALDPETRTVPLRPGHAGADRCAGPAGAAVPGPDPGGREAGGLSRSLPLSQLPVYDPGDGGEPAPARDLCKRLYQKSESQRLQEFPYARDGSYLFIGPCG